MLKNSYDDNQHEPMPSFMPALFIIILCSQFFHDSYFVVDTIVCVYYNYLIIPLTLYFTLLFNIPRTMGIMDVARIHMIVLAFLSTGLLVSISMFESAWNNMQQKRGGSSGDGSNPITSNGKEPDKTD